MLAQQTSAFPPVIAGHQYIRPLGAGGFADIFLYEQDMPRRMVAVKVMRMEVTDRHQAELFQREANALARVSSHPAILDIYHASISSDGRPYLALQYCPRSFHTSFRSDPMPVDQVLEMGIRLAGALETCHRAGILHRDIKPSNLLMSEFGRPMLSDFGIVGGFGADRQEEIGALSVPWSAPEVITRRSDGTVQSEIWSLAATLYAFLAGHGPFEKAGYGENADAKISARIRKAAYTPLGRSDVPEECERVLARAMAKNPEDRHASAVEFAEELRAVQRDLGLPLTAIEVTIPQPGGFAPPSSAALSSASDSVSSVSSPSSVQSLPAVSEGSSPLSSVSLSPLPASASGEISSSRSVGPVRSWVEVDSKRRRTRSVPSDTSAPSRSARPGMETGKTGVLDSVTASSTSSSVGDVGGPKRMSNGKVIVLVVAAILVTAALVAGAMTWMGA